MNIRKIQIRNFKCFEEETFELNPQFNVFIGDNGKGKTAVLDAVAVALGDCISFIEKKGTPLGHVQRKDIRIITIDGQPRPQFPVKISASAKLWEEMFDWYVIDNGTNSSYIKTANHSHVFYEKVEESRKESGVIFPLLAYYGTGRLWGKEEKIEYQKQEEGIMMAYPDCLEANTTSKAFFSWYKTLVYEVKAAERERDKIALKVVNDAICSMIPDWAGMYFSFKEDDIIGFLDGEERQFSQLSDGYRNTIGMVADMIYRCIQLNPHLGENTLKETPGVVLIDELDLHLHPNWQRHIVSDLKRIFPKVQFIATTHSPFIVQSLEADELKNLDGLNSVKNPEDMPLNKVITEIMQVESILSDDFEDRYKKALKTFEILQKEENRALNLSDYTKTKEFINSILLQDSSDPVYKAFLKATQEAKDETIQ